MSATFNRTAPAPAIDSAGANIGQFLVLGVHRSGTSLLTETAVRSGLHGGSADDLDGGDQWNANGYWEHRGVRALNEEILSATGTDWFAGLSVDVTTLPDKVRESFITRARSILETLDRDGPWVIKDPRLCVLLLPFWRPLLSNPGYLIALRNPLAVAHSLQVRDRFPVPIGLALWETQLLAALRASKGAPRNAFWYEELLARPEAEEERLRAWICDVTGGKVGRRTIASATDPSLRHQSIDPAEENDRLPDRARHLLNALRSGDAFLDSFDTTPSIDSRELIEFVDAAERTRRFLDTGWRQQQIDHRASTASFLRTLEAKDTYIAELQRQLAKRNGAS